MRKKPFFVSEIRITKDNKQKLIKAFQGNMIVYNYFLDLFTNNGLEVFRKRKFIEKTFKSFVKSNNVEYVVYNAAYNEIYYLIKKISLGNFKEKKLNDVQYLTITDNTLEVDFETRLCKIKFTDIEFYLVNNLKEEDFVKRQYIDISYSVNRDKFEFKLF